MRRRLVYLACPITAGNRNVNYFQAIEAERELMFAGFAPQNPAHTMTLPFGWQPDVPHTLWLDCCFPLVERCDAVLRLPGYSVGADAEVQHAVRHGVPVFYAVADLAAWRDAEEAAAADAQEASAWAAT